ncbi:MAG: HAMP domain-containing sensor histidine kinase [bacterium]
MKKISLIGIVVVVIVTLTTYLNYIIYNNHYNEKLLNIVNQLIINNEEIDVNDVASILKNPEDIDVNLLEQYGYSTQDVYFSNEMVEKISINVAMNILIVVLVLSSYKYIYGKKRKSNLKEINDIILLLDGINKGNFDIEIEKYLETDFSKLRNTIYKTTVLLKEQTEFLTNDRVLLKNNLADVSHQIRTPLTSISLMLESIIDDKDMDSSKKEEFLNKIYNKIESVNYLVEVLLKLSKFDASSIEFKQEYTSVYELLENIKGSLEDLAREKKVNIKINVNDNINIKCDRRWQEEAIGNIVKNAIDYSSINGVVEINVEDNNFYTKIIIKDNGQGMSKEELIKVFTRFYKSENSKGFGIGLNLAKTIIEKDNGEVNVESEKGKYTMFTIKYFKNLIEK